MCMILLIILEVAAGIEPAYAVLQTVAQSFLMRSVG
jgi:hypothetical protein